MYCTEIPVGNLSTPCDPTISKMYAVTNNTPQWKDKNYRHGRVTTDKLPERMNKRRNWPRKSIAVEKIAALIGGSWATCIGTLLWLEETPWIRADAEVGKSKRLVVRRVACVLTSSCYRRTAAVALADISSCCKIDLTRDNHHQLILIDSNVRMRFRFSVCFTLNFSFCDDYGYKLGKKEYAFFCPNLPILIVIFQIRTAPGDEDFRWGFRFQPFETNSWYVFSCTSAVVMLMAIHWGEKSPEFLCVQTPSFFIVVVRIRTVIDDDAFCCGVLGQTCKVSDYGDHSIRAYQVLMFR